MRSSLLLLCLRCSALELGAGLQVRTNNCSVEELEALVEPFEFLDPRLVMIAPDNQTLAEQASQIRNGALEKLECAMSTMKSSMELHALGGELASYLAAANPANRAVIGHIPNLLLHLSTQVYYSVHFRELDDSVLRDAENAAEAIAILAKADANNSEALLHFDAASRLAEMLERTDGEMTPKGYMWAAAALGNLMAAELDNPNATEYSQLAQFVIASRAKFMHRLVNLVREGTVRPEDPLETMPADAERTESARKFPHTYGWAVMHAISKMALHPEGRTLLLFEPGARKLFCGLKSSPDALESTKAKAIVAIASWDCDRARGSSGGA